IDIISQAINPKTQICVPMSGKKSDLKKRISGVLDRGSKKRSFALLLVMSVFTIALSACSGMSCQEKPALLNIADSQSNTVDSTGLTSSSQAPDILSADASAIPFNKNVNILVAGMDGDGDLQSRADTIMVVRHNIESGETSLLSIPRDTYVSPSEETLTKLKANYSNIPKEMKFGELIAYAGEKDKMPILRNEVSELLNVPVDFYVKVDMSAFSIIIDAFGGVEMTVPEGGLYYIDPAQNLEISLAGGAQILDGKKALEFVRYRLTYKNGDLDRINVQQELISQLYKKMFEGENVVEKSQAMFDILTKHTETNFTLSDLMSYLKYIPNVKSDSLSLIVLPCEMELIGNKFYLVPITKEAGNVFSK
ncbi:MAG: LCP family protein, partial [Clostridiales bacterium]|nr:LCP family protein [Clostridiales bacterium]